MAAAPARSVPPAASDTRPRPPRRPIPARAAPDRRLAPRQSGRLFRRTSAAAKATPTRTTDRPAASLQAPSEVIVEAVLGAPEAEHRPDRRRLLQREPYLRRRPLPERAFVREQLVHLVRLVGLDAELEERHVEDRFLRRVRGEADGDEDLVRPVLGHLRIEDHAVVVRAVESQVAIELQRRILVANPVQRRDPAADVPRFVEVALHELVLLRVGILFLAGQRAVLAQLVAGVDPER